MKRCILLPILLLAALTAEAARRPDSVVVVKSVALPENADRACADGTYADSAYADGAYAAVRSADSLTADPDAEFRRTHKRFLPMRRRIDREIGKLKYAYKGEVMLGLTASYGTLSSDDTDFMIIIDNINASGTIATVNPFFGYFYRDNNCVGIRFGYRHIGGTLGNVDLDLGEKNDISFSISDMELSSDNFSVGVFHRSYTGLDPKGRFGLFAELELSYSSGTSRFVYSSGDEVKYTSSDNTKVKLAFNPGMAVYIFPNVCGTLSFGLGGVQYSSIKQFDENGVQVGSRRASKMRFRLNLADINIGMIVHLWDKKKQ